MRLPSAEIEYSNRSIVQSLNNASFLSRGVVAQAALNNMRNLTEHVLVYAAFGDSVPYQDYWKAIKDALDQAKRCKKRRFIWDFHFNLQKVVSHYTPSETSSERLLLRYLELLFLLRKYAQEELGISILQNLELFPVKQDNALVHYYSEIADKTEQFILSGDYTFGKDRYYITSSKPIVLNNRIVYELSLTAALDGCGKTDRVIAFSNERIPNNNAVSLAMKSTNVSICGRQVPIDIVVGWRVSIRPCELNGILKALGSGYIVRGNLRNYRSLMGVLQDTGMNLCELCDLDDSLYSRYRGRIEQSKNNESIEFLLDECHRIIRRNGPGSNVMRYLLWRPRNEVINNQLQTQANNYLGYLYLRNECIPFDKNPFSSHLRMTKTRSLDVVRCIDPDGREADLLASQIITACENSRQIYIDEDEFDQSPHLDSRIAAYNNSLYRTHANRQIVHETGQLFIRGYEDDISVILNKLLQISKQGVPGYRASAEQWLFANSALVNDPVKKNVLESMFENTSVALVSGSAGTGKTTLLNYVCTSMQGIKVTAIANTNPAVESLRRRIKASACDFRTVTKYLNDVSQCDLLIVDECSTVSNHDMRQIMEDGHFKTLLLVGDVHQIEAIDFGNWFELAQTFLPEKCFYELTTTWRTTSESLLSLWKSVRDAKDDVAEILEANGYSCNLDDSLFSPSSGDEIVLCLNYDGLYGINNVNRILQSQNPNPVIKWGIHRYKIGDPILFNDSNRFAPLLYNNLKGRIVGIEESGEDRITFDIAVNDPINALSVSGYPGLQFVRNEGAAAVLRFSVCAINDPDEEGIADNVVPFNIAYAVSIHKAQGLEYDSVKLIVTENIEGMVSHNILYTAITRAKGSLKIYWTPETEAHVLAALSPSDSSRDACILARRLGLQMHP